MPHSPTAIKSPAPFYAMVRAHQGAWRENKKNTTDDSALKATRCVPITTPSAIDRALAYPELG